MWDTYTYTRSMESSRRIAFGLGAVAGLSAAFLADKYARRMQGSREQLAVDLDQQNVEVNTSDADSSSETVDKDISKYFK